MDRTVSNAIITLPPRSGEKNRLYGYTVYIRKCPNVLFLRSMCDQGGGDRRILSPALGATPILQGYIEGLKRDIFFVFRQCDERRRRRQIRPPTQ